MRLSHASTSESAFCCIIVCMNTPTKKREKVVKQAIANEKLEGLKVSRDTKKIADNYIVGKASAKATAAKIRARYGNL